MFYTLFLFLLKTFNNTTNLISYTSIHISPWVLGQSGHVIFQKSNPNLFHCLLVNEKSTQSYASTQNTDFLHSSLSLVEVDCSITAIGSDLFCLLG